MEEGRGEHMHDSLEEKDDSYIEIELDSRACGSSEEENDKIGDEEVKLSQEREEYGNELRISISSTIPNPDVHQQCVVSVDPPASTGPAPLRETDSADSDQRRVKLNRLCNFNVDFWENRASHHTHITLQTTMPFNSSNDTDLNSTTRHGRGNEGSMRRRNGGMIMKMLIKFRCIKLPTLISSLIKTARAPCQDHNNKGNTRKYCRTILQCYHQKNMVVNPSGSQQEATSARTISKPNWDLNNNNNNNNNISSNESPFRSSRRSSWNRSVVEIDLGALKGMFSAVGIAQKGTSSNSKRKSCSTMSSCDNSPIHEGFSFTCSDNSIQAAIAYCKTSFGQTSDFSF